MHTTYWRRPTDITGVSPWIIECHCRGLWNCSACISFLSLTSPPLLSSSPPHHICPFPLSSSFHHCLFLTYYSPSLPFHFCPSLPLLVGEATRCQENSCLSVPLPSMFEGETSAVQIFWGSAGKRDSLEISDEGLGVSALIQLHLRTFMRSQPCHWAPLLCLKDTSMCILHPTYSPEHQSVKTVATNALFPPDRVLKR